MQKKILLLFVVAIQVITLAAQKTEYITLTNIPYYPESVRQADAYIASRCVLDVYYPKNQKSFGTVVWFHGGGLTAGNKEIPEQLKGQGLCIIGVNYRLSPKVHSPEFIKDAAAAVAWTFQHIAEYGGDAKSIFVAGHSAGGYLTAMIGLDKRWLAAYGVDANRIAGLIPLSPQTITHFTIRKERGIAETTPVVDEFAPLNHVRADAPPMLLITGDREMEMLGRYEENAYLMRMMKVAGHKETRLLELQGYGHGMVEPGLPLLLNEVRRIMGTRSEK